jgi:hypothetical protein
MTTTERNSLRVLMVIVAVGWVGQLVGAIIHGGIDASTNVWFSRGVWAVVTVFVVVKYVQGTRAGISDE